MRPEPYALGGLDYDDTIDRLAQRSMIAASANNIHADERHGDVLQLRGVTYAVDYVANSGGTISDTDRFRKGSFHPERAWSNVRRVYDRSFEMCAIADRSPAGEHVVVSGAAVIG